MRISEKKLNSALQKQVQEMLFQALADLKTPKETKLFMEDFFTNAEAEVFTKRLAIAYWLKKGRTYANIKKNLKVSSATIANVQEMMQRPGFELLLKKVEAEEWASQWADKIKKFVGSAS
jgi:TrpR-related protein YerC/YecD